MNPFNQTRREMGFELNELKNHMECKSENKFAIFV